MNNKPNIDAQFGVSTDGESQTIEEEGVTIKVDEKISVKEDVTLEIDKKDVAVIDYVKTISENVWYIRREMHEKIYFIDKQLKNVHVELTKYRLMIRGRLIVFTVGICIGIIVTSLVHLFVLMGERL